MGSLFSEFNVCTPNRSASFGSPCHNHLIQFKIAEVFRFSKSGALFIFRMLAREARFRSYFRMAWKKSACMVVN